MAKRKPTPKKKPNTSLPAVPPPAEFDAVVEMIRTARATAMSAVNAALLDLYWRIGEHLSTKIAAGVWGDGTVEQLAAHIRKSQPNATGFSARTLWRTRQFFETYSSLPALAALARNLPWSHNLAILSRCKRDDEREFYLRLATRERWTFRDLQRQLDGALFERTALSPVKLSTPLTELHADAAGVFKDSYLVEFLQLPAGHAEADLQKGLVARLKEFLLELGRDFCFVGSQYPLQVGGKDFALDLLFFHRGMSALVAIELKVEEFQPEFLGKLEFYLEALDRDVRKPHERPSVGLLLCATKNAEVVEYALSRSVSPAVVSEYRTQLPDKAVLQAKLHEFYQLAVPAAEELPAWPKPPLPGRKRR